MSSKKLWAILVLCGATVAWGKSSHERAGIQHRPRPVTLEEDEIAQVFTAPGYETLIHLPPGEEIKQFGIGDGKRWVVECGVSAVADAGAKNLCHVKPGFANQSTNLNVITASGTFSFDLEPASSEHPVDLKVFVERRSEPQRLIASNQVLAPRVDTVPRSQLQAEVDAAARQADEFKSSIAALKLALDGEIAPDALVFYRVGSVFHPANDVVVVGDKSKRKTFILSPALAADKNPSVKEIVSRAVKAPVEAVLTDDKVLTVDHLLTTGEVTIGATTTRFVKKTTKHPTKG